MSEKLSNQALNVWLAENLFGFEWWRSSKTGRRELFPADNVPDWFTERADGTEELCFDHPSHVPNYCESLAETQKVIVECRKQNVHFLIQTHNNCAIAYRIEDEGLLDFLNFGAFADTLERSICDAAKEAIERIRKPESDNE